MGNITKASIIITTYNRPAFLERALKSCTQQETDFSYEIIVVDDNGLQSNMQKVTQALVEKFPMVHYIPLQKNSGACYARNEGVNKSNGEYLFFLDDDDELLPSKVQTQVLFLQENSLLHGSLASFKRIQLETEKEIFAETNQPTVGDFKNFVIRGNFFTPMLCIRKKAFQELGGFDDISRFQDRFFMIKALLQNFTFGIINIPLHVMYEHEGDRITDTGLDKSLNALDRIKTKVSIYKKQFSSYEWCAYMQKDLRMRATFYYLANNKKVRIKAAAFFFKSFQQSFNKNDIKMMFKSILKSI